MGKQMSYKREIETAQERTAPRPQRDVTRPPKRSFCGPTPHEAHPELSLFTSATFRALPAAAGEEGYVNAATIRSI